MAPSLKITRPFNRWFKNGSGLIGSVRGSQISLTGFSGVVFVGIAVDEANTAVVGVGVMEWLNGAVGVGSSERIENIFLTT